MERVASQLIEVIQVERTKHLVEHSERSANFKVKMTDLGKYWSAFNVLVLQTKKLLIGNAC